MASDGIWEVLGERIVQEVMVKGGATQSIADELVDRSIKNQVQYMGRNDATAVVIAVGEYSPGP
jgi:serine/threonine protein phosphatase PrpC